MNDKHIPELCDGIKKYGLSYLIFYYYFIITNNNTNNNSLSNNKIISEGAILLFDTLSEYCKELDDINISENKLDDNCMESLVNLLNELPIINIKLSNHSITDNGIEILSDGLIGNIILKILF